MVVSYQDKKKETNHLISVIRKHPVLGMMYYTQVEVMLKKRGHILDDWRNHPHWGFLVQAAYVRMVNRP